MFFGSIRFWFVTAVRKPWAKGLFFFFPFWNLLLHREEIKAFEVGIVLSAAQMGSFWYSPEVTGS